MADAPPPYPGAPQTGYNPAHQAAPPPQPAYPPQAPPPQGYHQPQQQQQPGYYQQPQQQPVVYQQPMQQQQQSVVIVNQRGVRGVGNCACGGTKVQKYQCLGILLAILCFPWGIICCLFMTEYRCNRCNSL